MRCSAFVIDVKAIRLSPNRNNVRTQLMQDRPYDLIRSAMSGINHYPPAAKIEVIREGAFAEFDVSPSSVNDASCFTQLRRRHASDRRI